MSNADGNNEIYLTGSPITPFRITYNPADDTDPALAPGGSLVAFASDRSGSFDLYAAKTDLTGFVRLTEAPTDEREPDWSPDGSKLVFRSDRDGDNELFVLDLVDNTVTQLTHNSVDDLAPSWSPTGEWIAFMTWLDGSNDIAVIRPDGTGLRRVTCDDANDGFPSWASYGLRISFQSDRTGNSDIFIVAFDETGTECEENQLTQFTTDPSDDMTPSWAGPVIWFMTSRFGTFDLVELLDPDLGPSDDRDLEFGDTEGVARWQFTFDGFPSASSTKDFTGTFPLSIPSSPIRPLTEPSIRALGGVWSYDAARIAFISRQAEEPQVVFMDSDGKHMQSVDEITGDAYLESGLPSWSPTDNRLAFLARRADGRTWLHVLDLDEGVARPLYELPEGQDGHGVSWSPDGSKIAILLWGEFTRDPVMARITSDDGLLLETRQGVLEAAYSPDGGMLALIRRDADGYKLATLDTQSGVEATIREWRDDPNISIGDATWSPEGDRLVYAQFRDVNYSSIEYEIDSVRTDGGDNRILTTLWGAYPSGWLPNARFIVFHTYEPGGPMIMRPDGTDIMRLSADPAALESDLFALSPDGRFLLFTSFLTDSTQIYVLRLPPNFVQDDS